MSTAIHCYRGFAHLLRPLLLGVVLFLFGASPGSTQSCSLRSACCSDTGILSRCGTAIDCRYFLDATYVDVVAIPVDTCEGICVVYAPDGSIAGTCPLCLRTRFLGSVGICQNFEYEVEFYLCCRDSGCCPGAF